MGVLTCCQAYRETHGTLLLPVCAPKAVPCETDNGCLEAKDESCAFQFQHEVACKRSGGWDRSAPTHERLFVPRENTHMEMERLQDMVREFAKAAVKGVRCHWLPGGDRPCEAILVLSTTLREVFVSALGKQTLLLQMSELQDILKDARGTPFEYRLMQPDDPARFVCLQLNAVDSADGELGTKSRYTGLLLPNPHERERVYTCLKILRWAVDRCS